MVSLQDAQAAADRIRAHVIRTPLEQSAALSAMCGTDVWLKFECFQLTGSFKLRGALNALLQRQASRVVTASAGNHGLGVARAAAMLGVSATVVVPLTASTAKDAALRRSGAELIQVGETYDDAEVAAIELARDRGVPYISAYNDPQVIAGGGTVALEILEDLPDTRSIVVPAGGGGLISGIAIAAPNQQVFGVQSEASPALHAALQAGQRVEVDVRPSLADGLAGNVEPGSITFDLVRAHVREIVLVSEHAIAEAMGWLLLNEHVVVEGSAAVGVAALLDQRIQPTPSGPVAVILTGRNLAGDAFQAGVSTALTRVGGLLNDPR